MGSERPVAVIDIGSNSIRLVVYERLARAPTPLFNEKMLAGLGASVAESGRLSASATAKALASLRRFSAIARQLKVAELDVVATAAIREAANGKAFIAEAQRIFAVPVRILSGSEEARVAALGVLAGFADPDGVAGDLGGGSLELTELARRAASAGESLSLGALRLQSVSGGSLAKARDMVLEQMRHSAVLPRLGGRTFFAIGGAWRSLAKLYMHWRDYPLHVMHEFRATPAELQPFLAQLIEAANLDAFPGIDVVSKQRQALMPYGALVMSEIMAAGRPECIAVSALGLREGLLFDKLPESEQQLDPLLSAARELAATRSRSPAHAEELMPWTRDALAALGFAEAPEEERLRCAACLLSDIGWRAHPDYRGEQSLNIIAHAAFVGLDHPGRAFLALAVFYRHAGLSERELGGRLRELAPPEYRERARALAGAFRVAYLISAATSGVLPRTRLRRSGKTIELRLPADLTDLAGPRLESRLRQFGALKGLSTAVVAEKRS